MQYAVLCISINMYDIMYGQISKQSKTDRPLSHQASLEFYYNEEDNNMKYPIVKI